LFLGFVSIYLGGIGTLAWVFVLTICIQHIWDNSRERSLDILCDSNTHFLCFCEISACSGIVIADQTFLWIFDIFLYYYK
jgi:hypothetical protein